MYFNRLLCSAGRSTSHNTRPSAQHAELNTPDPWFGKSYYYRPLFVLFQAHTGRHFWRLPAVHTNPVGTCVKALRNVIAPCIFKISGRAGTKPVTNTATGLAGRPRNSASCNWPKATGLPGFIAMRRAAADQAVPAQCVHYPLLRPIRRRL